MIHVLSIALVCLLMAAYYLVTIPISLYAAWTTKSALASDDMAFDAAKRAFKLVLWLTIFVMIMDIGDMLNVDTP